MPVGSRSSNARSRVLWPCAGGAGSFNHSAGACGASVSSVGGSGVISAAGGSDEAAMVSLSRSRRSDNCRASSLNALFSTGVSVGDLVSPGARNGRTLGGVSTGVSGSVGCEFASVTGSGSSASGSGAGGSIGGGGASGSDFASGSGSTTSADRLCGAGGSASSSKRLSASSRLRPSTSRQTPNPLKPAKLRA
ncbi:hypothetical protein ACVWWR_001828 [Bradyrhizobium sp. LM3.2]